MQITYKLPQEFTPRITTAKPVYKKDTTNNTPTCLSHTETHYELGESLSPFLQQFGTHIFRSSTPKVSRHRLFIRTSSSCSNYARP